MSYACPWTANPPIDRPTPAHGATLFWIEHDGYKIEARQTALGDPLTYAVEVDGGRSRIVTADLAAMRAAIDALHPGD